jgi:multidrug efflux pump subunit AcrB
VATLCICIVFVPMFFLNGVARYLFVPLAEAICFAMLASYVLSRTLIPTLAKYWLRMHGGHVTARSLRNPLVQLQQGFQYRFEALRHFYRNVLESALSRRVVFIPAFPVSMLLSLALVPWLGSNFFPSVDSGEIKLHVRGHAGLRVEETARLCYAVETALRNVIPANEIASLVDNIGLPVSGINLSYSNSAPTTAGRRHPRDA